MNPSARILLRDEFWDLDALMLLRVIRERESERKILENISYLAIVFLEHNVVRNKLLLYKNSRNRDTPLYTTKRRHHDSTN